MQVMGKLMTFLRRKGGTEDDPDLQIRRERERRKKATTIPDERTIRRLLDAHNSNLAFLSEHLDEYCRQQPEQYLGRFLVIAKGGEIFETFPSERKAEKYFHGLSEDTQDEAAIWFIDDSDALEAYPI